MNLPAALHSDDDGGFSLWPSASINPVSRSGVNPAWGEDQPGRGPGQIWPSKGGGNFWMSESTGKAKGGGQQSAGQAGRTPSGPRSLTVPYHRNFPDGLHDGLLVIITGTPEQSVNRFTVDFETKEDIAFHFNPRFDESVIVMNSCIQKKWGKEERKLKDFPFIKGQPFKIKFKCTSSGFEVSMKDAPLLMFKHRVKDLKSVTKLGIGRGVQLSDVEVPNP